MLAYGEADNLKFMIPQIKDSLNTIAEINYEIIVIDGEKSIDDSRLICEKHNVKYYNQEEPGFGGALRTAIKKAGNDLFLILDADGSHNPKYIPDIYNKFVENNCDLVIGSRYVSGGQNCDAKSSVIMSKMLNFAFRIVIGVKIKDLSTDYRLYKTEQLKKLRLGCQNYDILQEVILKLKLNNKEFKYDEVPIKFEKRINGKSKRKLFKYICSYIKTLFMLIYVRARKG